MKILNSNEKSKIKLLKEKIMKNLNKNKIKVIKSMPFSKTKIFFILFKNNI